MVLISIVDGTVAWSCLVVFAVTVTISIVKLPDAPILRFAEKRDLALAAAARLGVVGVVMFVGALLIGHGNLLYLSGMRNASGVQK